MQHFFLSFFLLINNLAKLMQSKERAGQRVYLGLSEINIFMCCKCKAFLLLLLLLLINNLAKLMQSKERGYILVSVKLISLCVASAKPSSVNRQPCKINAVKGKGRTRGISWSQ